MNVAICFNHVPPKLFKGEEGDRISEEGAEAEARDVCQALKELGHDPLLLPLGAAVDLFLAELRRTAPDVVFNLCEGFWGDSRKEMHVAALLELLDQSFTGSSSLTLGLTQDKVRTKDLLLRHGLPTPRYLLIGPGEQYPRTRDLTFPLIVKPRFEDASLGISHESIVETEADLARRIRYVHDTYRQGALVEEFIEGREINAAVLGSGSFKALPLSEIVFRPGLPRPIVSYEGKWMENSSDYVGTEPVCPADISVREESLLKEVSLQACQILEVRDYARVDIRLRDGVPYILEVNANPDISRGAGLAKAARMAGIPYTTLIGHILEMAMKRKETAHAAS